MFVRSSGGPIRLSNSNWNKRGCRSWESQNSHAIGEKSESENSPHATMKGNLQMSARVVEVTRCEKFSLEVSSGSQAGDVEIHSRSGCRLEVRYFDEPDRFRRWMIPLSYAVDLAGWWQGARRAGRSSKHNSSEAQYGCINVAVFSPNQIYFRGRSPLGRPNVTGFQLPRPAVEALCAYCAYCASQPVGFGVSASSLMSDQQSIPHDLRGDV